MTYMPKDIITFLDHAGERFVRTALTNGEFNGKLETAARQWLSDRNNRRMANLARWGIAAAFLAVLFGFALTWLFDSSRSGREPEADLSAASGLPSPAV